MSVEIDPLELGFHRPFTQEVSQILRIRNPNITPVAFKVKTTAPKQYCVRPNSGRIEPGKEVEVSVLLQAMKQEPPPDAKCRDKFLVQSVAVTPDKEFENVGAIWSHVDAVEKSSVQEKKIRVAFLPPQVAHEATTPVKPASTNGVNGAANSAPDATPAAAYLSPQTEEQATPDAKYRNAAQEPSTETKPADNKVSAAITTGATAVSNAIPSYDDLKAQLADAQTKLASYAQESGLRLRKPAGGQEATTPEGTTEVAQRAHATEGVPIQIVAALCLISFLLAYLFF
ncbi:hypothetical protein DH86_00001515 [Scytalidium sp. 3C]|nr:hypothetical protein DH86_00001515 [Scytalidium sp. 3C]